ncbi:MAG: polysaccharide biosynthesis C-terminal domain-containing protein [Oscillospiraceae bacterium]|nr:polysaccharide biosynthesis C-terminal domain-containing protein [Oscillospiraceae bacterium]
MRQTVLRGSVWLIASALTAKLLGAVFRIPLTAMLGGGGMGYYACAYGLFLPVFALSVTGMNTAVAALTAQCLGRCDPAGADRIPLLARRMFGLSGLAGSLLLYFGAVPLCEAMGNPGAAFAVRLFSPAVWLCCMNAVLRGAAEGRSDMVPTAVSQVTEGIGRLCFGLLLCRWALRNPARLMRFAPAGTSPEAAAAAAAVFGVTLSAAVGTLTLLFLRAARRGTPASGTPKQSDAALRRALLRLLLPIAAASLVTNLTTLIDMATAIRLLTAAARRSPEQFPFGGSTPEETANFCFGAFSGMAMTVFNLVPSVTNNFGKSVLPAFASSYARQRPDETAFHAQTVMRRTAFFAVPAGLGITVLAQPVLSVLFPLRMAEVSAASPALCVLGIGVIFTAMVSPVFSMMQAAGRAGDSVTAMLTGAAVKLLGNLLLIPRFHLSGAAASTLLCYAVIWMRASALFYRSTGIRLRLLRICGRALAAGLLCAFAAGAVYPLIAVRFHPAAALFCAVCAGGCCDLAVYVLLSPHGLDSFRTVRYNKRRAVPETDSERSSIG